MTSAYRAGGGVPAKAGTGSSVKVVIYSNSWRVSIIKLGINLLITGLRSLSRHFLRKIVETIMWRDIRASSMLVLLRNTAMTTIDLIKWRIPLGNRALRATSPFSLITWRKVEKRYAEIEKPGVLFACSAFPGYSQLYHSCHLLISYGENRDVDFDTFFETAHHFLFSTRLLPLTIEEKLSQMCQETGRF
jgi:hypothetical protein